MSRIVSKAWTCPWLWSNELLVLLSLARQRRRKRPRDWLALCFFLFPLAHLQTQLEEPTNEWPHETFYQVAQILKRFAPSGGFQEVLLVYSGEGSGGGGWGGVTQSALEAPQGGGGKDWQPHIWRLHPPILRGPGFVSMVKQLDSLYMTSMDSWQDCIPLIISSRLLRSGNEKRKSSQRRTQTTLVWSFSISPHRSAVPNL